jgi:hypothetical protein
MFSRNEESGFVMRISIKTRNRFAIVEIQTAIDTQSDMAAGTRRLQRTFDLEYNIPLCSIYRHQYDLPL